MAIDSSYVSRKKQHFFYILTAYARQCDFFTQFIINQAKNVKSNSSLIDIG